MWFGFTEYFPFTDQFVKVKDNTQITISYKYWFHQSLHIGFIKVFTEKRT